MTRTAGLLTVFLAELSTLGRGRYARFGIAGLFALYLPLAVGLGTSAYSAWFFLFFIYGIVPSAFGVLAAQHIAAPRATRFVQAVFTSPVRRSTYLTARFLVVLTMGAAYLVLTLPFHAAYALLIGVPPLYSDFLQAGALVVLFGAAYGTFLGVVFTGRSTAAATTLAAVPALLFLAVPFLIIFGPEARGNLMREAIIRLLHLSPTLNAMDAVGVNALGAPVEIQTIRILFFGTVAALVLGAFSLYLRHQSVESWEQRPSGRGALFLVVLIALLSPALIAPIEYEAERVERPPEREMRHPITSAVVVEPGRPLETRFVRHSWRDDPNILVPLDGPARAELIVLFTEDHAYAGPLRIDVRGGLGLQVSSPMESIRDAGAGERLTDAQGNRHTAVRVPLTITPISAHALRDVSYLVDVWANDTTAPEPESGFARIRLDARHPDGTMVMALAAAIMPLAFLFTGVANAIRRR